MSVETEKLLKPTLFAEHTMLTNILNGTWPPGTTLPSERELAKQIGVTRPTLRETLQRLASEGWITIQHGKPTTVNDFRQKGGLVLLKTLVRYNQFLPDDFIDHLLTVRDVVVPAVANMSAQKAPDQLREYLEKADRLDENAEAFSTYDWELHLLMAKLSGNPIFLMMLNDFTTLYHSMGLFYFSIAASRALSREYYAGIIKNIEKGPEAVEASVRTSLKKVYALWMQIKKQGEK